MQIGNRVQSTKESLQIAGSYADEYKYLGVMVTKDRNRKTEIRDKVLTHVLSITSCFIIVIIFSTKQYLIYLKFHTNLRLGK